MAAAVPAAGLFAYFVLPNLDQRSYDLVVSLAALTALLAILVLLWVGRRRSTEAPVIESRWPGRLMALLTVAAVFGNLVGLALAPESFFSSTTNYLTTEMISRITAFLLALGLTLGFILAISRSLAKLKPAAAAVWAGFAIAPILVGQLTATLQMLLVTGRIAVSPRQFNLIAVLINSRMRLLGIEMAAVLALAVMGWLYRRRLIIPEDDLNPAERRRIKAGRRRDGRTTAGLILSALLMAGFIWSETVFAQKEIALSPAKPVRAREQKIRIPVTTIKDKRLHRFSFNVDGANIRFLVVHKGSGVFSAAFDACEFCGTVGYYQREDNIVCKNCEAYINVATFGLPGGCNPIPLRSTVVGNFLEIEQAGLAARKGDDWN